MPSDSGLEVVAIASVREINKDGDKTRESVKVQGNLNDRREKTLPGFA